MINEQTLTLYYYADELTEAQRAEVSAALEKDPDLARRYAQLRQDLDALGTAGSEPAPAAAISRWHQAIDAAADTRRPAAAGVRHGWWLLLPAAAALLAGIGIGLRVADQPIPERVVNAPPAQESYSQNGAGAPSAPLTRGLTDYMQRSRVQLASLADASPEKREQLISDIVEQNRLFERAAAGNGLADLARVLRAFDQILAELARQDTGTGDSDDRAAQLSFEYSAMLTKLSRQPSDITHTL